MSFITFRRHYLDNFLLSTKFYGRVLDIGGKKENKRGAFRPPYKEVEKWEYLNIDASTNPDYCCGAELIPVEDKIFDFVLITEVLEHIENPEIVIHEMYRVLKEGGYIIASIPFLYAIHADPYDFQRWTPEKLKIEFKKANLNIEKIESMGSIFAVIYDLLYIFIRSDVKSLLLKKILIKTIMPIIKCVFIKVDNIYRSQSITTGYSVIAKKSSSK